MRKKYILLFLLTTFMGVLTVNSQSETVMDYPNLPIPDDEPTGVSTTLTVINNFVMTDVDIHVEANHTWIGDLIFDITSPAGTTVRIIDRPGVPNSTYGCSSNGPEITLDDDALDPIETTCLTTNDTIIGTYSPNNPLSAFNGENSAGTWTLTVSDNEGGDTGNLLSWGITFTYSGGCIQDELTAVPFLSGNNFAGNMFDVSASGGADILIEKFDINIGVGPANISVFSRPGSYVGFENSSTGWTLMGNETVTGQGSGIPTELNVGGLVIPDGETYGIYITVTDYPSVLMFYTNGDNIFSDSSITITTGVGKGNPDFTGSTFASRSWNGTIYYCATAVSACDMPTAVTSDTVGVTTAEFSWIASATETGGYDWAVMVVGEDPSMDVPVESGTVATGVTTIIVTDLVPETSYDFYVRTNCGPDGMSNWAGPLNFTTDTAASVNDNTIDGFVIYPNPVANVLNLESNLNIEGVTVFNMLGQKVLSQTIGATSSQINVSDLNTGSYLIKVHAEGQTATYQFVKK